MIKKLAIACLLACLCISTVGCSGVSKEYDGVKKAQAEVIKQNSCHMVISSKVNAKEKTDAIVTDFTYKVNDKGVMEYCHSQQDSANKLVYCEYSDGVKAEQWLLGNGWSVIEPVAYTKENPHRYIELLTSAIDKKAISKLTKDKVETNTQYNISLNASKLNKTTYKDAPIEVISQNISFLVNAKGELICYNDKAVIFDKETKSEAEYLLEVQLSEHNAIAEVKKPEVRANALVKPAPKPTTETPAKAEVKPTTNAKK